jgi:hypothetical protein
VPNFRAVFDATGRDMARAMADWVAARVRDASRTGWRTVP